MDYSRLSRIVDGADREVRVVVHDCTEFLDVFSNDVHELLVSVKGGVSHDFLYAFYGKVMELYDEIDEFRQDNGMSSIQLEKLMKQLDVALSDNLEGCYSMVIDVDHIELWIGGGADHSRVMDEAGKLLWDAGLMRRYDFRETHEEGDEAWIEVYPEFEGD